MLYIAAVCVAIIVCAITLVIVLAMREGIPD